MIATDWLYNSDVVLNGKTGLLVPVKNPQELANAIMKLYNNRELQFDLAKNSLQEAKKYDPDVILASFYKTIES